MDQGNQGSVEQEMEMIMHMVEQDDQAAYVTLHAPSPYHWDTDNVITHFDAIDMGVTCMNPYPNVRPCKDFRECLTCQGFKGSKWNNDQAEEFFQALKLLKTVMPNTWSLDNTQGN